jgi:hypothetical protein
VVHLDRTLVGAEQPPFHERRHPVHPGEQSKVRPLKKIRYDHDNPRGL